MPDGYNKFTNPKAIKETPDKNKKNIFIPKFPIVLAGPIIKRAEPKNVYIWICTSKPLKLGAIIYSGIPNLNELEKKYPIYFDRQKQNQQKQGFLEKITTSPYTTQNPFRSWQQPNEPYTEIGSGFSISYKVGMNMFIHLIKLVPNNIGKFSRGVTLSYEVLVLEKEESFANAKLLFDKKERELITIDYSSPVFTLQKEDKDDLRVAFGSCRKFHGEAKDTTIALFENKYKSKKKVLERPNALFLLGDQIYADDVSEYIIPSISLLSTFLVGQELLTINRIINDYNNGKPQYIGKINTADIKVGKRKNVINSPSFFTSTDCDNHLASFGEYCSMYLLAFNGALWESEKDLIGKIKYKENLIKSEKGEFQYNYLHSKYSLNAKSIKDDIKIIQLIEARKGSEAMRKILANTPTYMICDDHEITDDWFITNEWKNTVSNNPLGARIVTNGICAYWFFQWLGNDPENNVGENLNSKFWEKISQSRQFETSFITDKEVIQKCSDYPNWSYLAPTYPSTVFLDTRFNRENTKTRFVNISDVNKGNGFIEYIKDIAHYKLDDENCYSPSLINDKQIDRISKLLNKPTQLIIATPTPVFGLKAIENIIESNFTQGSRESFMDKERELWSCNPYGVTKFLNLVKILSKDVKDNFKIKLLSGDVHYSFFNKVTLNIKGKSEVIEIDMVTSSGIKNPTNPDYLGMAHKPADLLPKSIKVHIKKESFNHKYKNEPLLLITTVDNQFESDYKYISVLKKLPNINEFMWKSGSFGFLNGDKTEFIVPKT